MISWNEYKEWLGGDLVVSEKQPLPIDVPVPGEISTDSRTISPGQWFVPLYGENFDGHNFIAEAIKKGARGFFFEKDKKPKLSIDIDRLGVGVKNTLSSLQLIAKGWRKRNPNFRIIALTGSTGKTTTKELVAAVLKKNGRCLASPGNFNNEIGVPLSLLKISSDLDYGVFEFGARHEGDIAFLTGLVDPQVVSCINVGTAHLGEFGSIENLLRTKLEIFSNSSPTAVLIANRDDERIFSYAKKAANSTISFGFSEGADVKIEKVIWQSQEAEKKPLAVLFNIKEQIYNHESQYAHVALPINMAAAIAMCLGIGIAPEAVFAGLTEFSGNFKGRFQIQKLKDFVLVDDSYNANPESMRAGFETLAKLYKREKKILVLGDMLELGEKTEEAHRSVGELCVKIVEPVMLVTIGPGGKIMAEGARKMGLKQKSILSFDTVADLINANIKYQKYGEVVYAKSSNALKLKDFISHLLAVK